MTYPQSWWRGLSVKGQSILQFGLPDNLNDRMSVTLFLKGDLMKQAAGSPELASKILFNEVNGDLLVAPKQIHGTAVVKAIPLWALPARPKADAVFIFKKGIYGSLRFADCLPVVAASSNPFDWVVLIHSGFSGTAKGILHEVMDEVNKFTRSDVLDHTHFWIGPGIGPCCYSRRIGDPSTEQGIINLPSECIHRDGNLVYFDLFKANVTYLYDMGVSPERVHVINICTSCSSFLCHSYRAGDHLERSFLLARVFPEYHKRYEWWENI